MITVDSVVRIIRDHDMIKKGDRVTAGISGGADSMCLLFLMSKIREMLGFSLEAVHVNHGIRGESADKDEDCVRRICGELKVSCRVFRFDVPSYASEHSLSEEEAGRILRYRALREGNSDRIAVAHHANDSAETVLFNLFRGTGLRGLSGIRPVSGDIIRPLLFFTREETEGFCRENGIDFREDETNADPSYGRNRIRLNIIPEAEKINPAAIRHILEAADRIEDAFSYIDAEVEASFNEAAEREKNTGRLSLDIEKIRDLKGCVRELVLRRCIAALSGSEKDITALHLKETGALLFSQSGKRASLPYGISVIRSFDKLVFSRDEGEGGSAGSGFEIPFTPREGEETELSLPDGSIARASFTDIPEEIPNLQYTKWMDYDKIIEPLVWRTRRQGDRISIKGGSRKLKDLFIDERIPRDERDGIILLASGSGIVWIPGLRIGEDYKVTEGTKKVLRITYGKEHH